MNRLSSARDFRKLPVMGLVAQCLPRPLHEMEDEPDDTAQDPARETQQRDNRPVRTLHDRRVQVTNADRTRQ